MKKKHFFLIAILVLLGAAALTSCGRHRPGHRPDPEVILNRMDARVRKLDLSDDQQVQYDVLRDRLETDLDQDFSELKRIPELVERELERENPDMEQLAENLKAASGYIPDVRGKYIDYFVEFYSILDEEQQQEVINHMRKRMNRWHRMAG